MVLSVERCPNPWKKTRKTSLGSLWYLVAWKRLDLATLDVIVFLCSLYVIQAPKDSFDANIIPNVSSDLPSAHS